MKEVIIFRAIYFVEEAFGNAIIIKIFQFFNFPIFVKLFKLNMTRTKNISTIINLNAFVIS